MSKRKLLLADDSITIQKVVNLTFADEGIEVIAVGDGDAAMQKFVESTPDLVMADVNMPGVDGYRICEMIKQDDETSQIPVILLVGSFEPFDEAEAQRVGADDYLTKPFQSIRQLVNMVTDLLNSTNGEEPPIVEELTEIEEEENSTPSYFEEEEEHSKPPYVEENESYTPLYMETATAQLGDAGMDDEMIQTDQIGVIPIDEPRKFESAEQQFADTLPSIPTDSYQSDFESPTGYEADTDFAKTQPLTTQEYMDITAPTAEDNSAKSEEKGYELVEEQTFEQSEIVEETNLEEPEISESQPMFEPEYIPERQPDFEPEYIAEQQFAETEPIYETEQPIIEEDEPAVKDENEFAPSLELDNESEFAPPIEITEESEFALSTESSEAVPMPEVASVLDLDEMNLLELPPREKKDSSDFQLTPVASDKIEPETQSTKQSESRNFEEEDKAETDLPEFVTLSPASIEAIAERVADLVARKMSL